MSAIDSKGLFECTFCKELEIVSLPEADRNGWKVLNWPGEKRVSLVCGGCWPWVDIEGVA